MDFPLQPQTYPSIGILNSFGAGSYVAAVQRPNAGAAAVSVAWPVAKLVMYMPVALTDIVTLATFAWANGATVATTNHIEGGVYDEQGTQMAHTNVVSQGTASVVQTASLIAASGQSLTVKPAVYFLALTCDTTVATFQISSGVVQLSRACGLTEQTLSATYTVGSSVLPTPAVMAGATTSGRVPQVCVSYAGGTF